MKQRSSMGSWGTGVAAAFALFLCGMAVMVYAAVSGRVDLVADDYYQQGLRYEERIHMLKRGETSKHQVRVSLHDGQILVSFGDSAGRESISGQIVFYRPANRALDRTVTLATDSSGRQRVSTATMAPGLWRIQLSWTERGLPCYAEKALLLQSRESAWN